MRKLVALAVCAFGCLALTAQAHLNVPHEQFVRGNIIIDDDYGLSGDTAVGWEFAVGGKLFEADEAGLLLQYMDEDNDLYRLLGLFVEEYFDLGHNLFPFIGVAIGYGWQELDARDDEEAFVVRGQAGLKYHFHEHAALSGRLQYSLSDEDLFVEDSGPEGNNFEYGIGLRFYW